MLLKPEVVSWKYLSWLEPHLQWLAACQCWDHCIIEMHVSSIGILQPVKVDKCIAKWSNPRWKDCTICKSSKSNKDIVQ